MYSFPEEMVIPKLLSMALVLRLISGTVDSQYCDLSNDQHQQLIQGQQIRRPKYVVYAKNQDSNSLKHVFEGFNR